MKKFYFLFFFEYKKIVKNFKFECMNGFSEKWQMNW